MLTSKFWLDIRFVSFSILTQIAKTNRQHLFEFHGCFCHGCEHFSAGRFDDYLQRVFILLYCSVEKFWHFDVMFFPMFVTIVVLFYFFYILLCLEFARVSHPRNATNNNIYLQGNGSILLIFHAFRFDCSHRLGWLTCANSKQSKI